MNVNTKCLFSRKQAFKKRERLSKKEISQLFRKGKRIKVKDYLGIYFYNDKPFPKLGVSLRKKLGNAIKRNYERRIIKEVFRCYKPLLPNVDLMIIKIGRNTSSYQQKEKELKCLFRKIL